MAAMQLAKDKPVLRIEVAESEKEECINKAEVAIDDKEKMLTEIEAMETKHIHTNQPMRETTSDSLKHQFSEATSQITQLTNQLSVVSAEKKDISTKVESTSSDLTALRDDISKLESSIESLTTERDAANERVSQLLSGSNDAEEVLSCLKSEKDELASSLEKTKADITCLETEKEETVAKLIGLKDGVVKLQGQTGSLSAENNDLKSELEAATAKYNAIESEQKECMQKLEGVTGNNEKLRDTITNLEAGVQQKTDEMARVCSEMEVSTSQMLAQQKQMESIEEKLNLSITDKDSILRELKGTKEALSISKGNQMKAEEQVAQVLFQQKETESIENQVNSSVSNKDTLLRELEKTALLKELKKTKETLSNSEKKHAKAEMQLVALLSQQKPVLKKTNEALSLSKEKNATAEKQLARIVGTKQGKSIQEMKRDEALADKRQLATQQPQDVKEINFTTPTKANSLVIDTSANESHASSEKVETPSSARSSSSAVLHNFSKFDSIKQRYRKKMLREIPKTIDNDKPTMTKTSQEMSQDVKQNVADSRRQVRYRDKERKTPRSPG